MATYLHIDVDAFLASVEQSINRKLKGKPVMVGGLENERGIVYCPSYEARARGVTLGTSLPEAARRIPDGVLVRGDWFTYEQYSNRLMDIIRDFTPKMDQISPDEACLDISGLERHFASPVDLAQKLKNRVMEELSLSTSVGIGPSRVVAKIASEIIKPNNLTYVAPDEAKEFLAPLKIGKIPGIGRVGKRILYEMGVKTIGQLQLVPEEYLVKLFGQNGRKIAAYSVGEDGPLLRDFSAVRSVNRETGLARDITDNTLLLSHYFYLLERACRRLRDIHKKAGRMTVKFRYCDFENVEGHATISPPSWDEKVLYGIAKSMFETMYKRRKGIRFVGVNLNNLKNSVYEESFIFDRTEKNEKLLGSVDEVREKFGFLAVTTGRTLMLGEHYNKRVTGYELRTPGLSK
ncbi:MAG: DNA polymerase IV [Candidatus Zixiibacteriota bacterium]